MEIHKDIIDANIRKRQNALLCKATEYGLPRHFARDLFLDCEELARVPDITEFCVLLRDSGSSIAYDARGAETANFWIDANDPQAFFIYRAHQTSYSTEDGELKNVSKREFKAFLEHLTATKPTVAVLSTSGTTQEVSK